MPLSQKMPMELDFLQFDFFLTHPNDGNDVDDHHDGGIDGMIDYDMDDVDDYHLMLAMIMICHDHDMHDIDEVKHGHDDGTDVSCDDHVNRDHIDADDKLDVSGIFTESAII